MSGGHNVSTIDKIGEDYESCAVWDVGSLSEFPEEVWEHILNRVKNSMDIHVVLLTFPELDRCFHSKKVTWMFGQVLPQLMTKYLVNRKLFKSGDQVTAKECLLKELFKLRLVSKGWKCAVDFSLKNHADRNPPHSTDADKNPEILVPMNSFNYSRIANFRLGVTNIKTAEEFDKFVEQMSGGHDGNPFPGKSVCLRAFLFFPNYCNSIAEKCVELFEQFGKYILSLEIQFEINERLCDVELIKNILKCLSHVPNLRSLAFSGEMGLDPHEKLGKHFNGPENSDLFPELPCLQTFDWKCTFFHEMRNSAASQLAIRLLKKYGGANGILRLEIDLNSIMTPNLLFGLKDLTELHLELHNRTIWSVSDVATILEKLPNGQQLQTFGINTISHSRRVTNINELIRLLAKFKIRNVFLDDVKLVEEPITPQLQAFRLEEMCITSLHLRDSLNLNYGFLKLLPNLEVLHIHFVDSLSVDSFPSSINLSEYSGNVSDRTMGKTLRLYLRKVFHDGKVGRLDGIWKELPKLKTLKGSVEVKMCTFNTQYGI